jgi:hypothetical protein
MVWPALALIGFVVLMTFVIALGTVSTNRYEREQRARARCSVPARHSIGLPGTT